MQDPTVGILLRDRMGNDVYGTNTHHLGKKNMTIQAGDSLDLSFSFPMNIGPGNYSVCVAVHAGDSHLDENCDWWDQCMALQVIPGSGPSFVGVAALPVDVKINHTKAA